MAGLSVAHRVALVGLLEAVPERKLDALARASEGFGGALGGELRLLIEAEALDRRRMARAFAVIVPLFRPRTDGVEALAFPNQALGRLWRLAANRETAVLELLDGPAEEAEAAVDLACGRLLTAAAAVARDAPDAVWPEGSNQDGERLEALAELARCCDLAPLIHRRLGVLARWADRPDEQAAAQLRLLVRDCTDLSADGGGRLVEILLAHLPIASQVLHVIVNAFHAAQSDSVLSKSDLAVFAERLLDAAEARAGDLRRFAARAPSLVEVEPFRRDLAWVGDSLADMERTLTLAADGPWAGRIRAVRRQLGQILGDRLTAAPKALDGAMPVARVHTSGRMTRLAPNLETPPRDNPWPAAEAAAELLRVSRGPAAAFGCEAKRRQICEAVIARANEYACEVLEAVNGGEVRDEAAAVDRVERLAGLLVRLEAPEEARALRRRSLVAGGTTPESRAGPPDRLRARR